MKHKKQISQLRRARGEGRTSIRHVLIKDELGAYCILEGYYIDGKLVAIDDAIICGEDIAALHKTIQELFKAWEQKSIGIETAEKQMAENQHLYHEYMNGKRNDSSI